MKGRKTLRRAGIVLAFGALLSAGMLASGALGMVSIISSTTDSTSTATETAPPPSTTTMPTDTTATDTTPTTTAPADTTTTEATTTSTTTTTSAFSPSITSDKDDYAPGSMVTLAGAGWGPGEAVRIVVNDDVGQSWSYTYDVTADIGGSFTHQFQLPDWFIANYSVTATGPTSGTARTTFTDANVGNISGASPVSEGGSGLYTAQISGCTAANPCNYTWSITAGNATITAGISGTVNATTDVTATVGFGDGPSNVNLRITVSAGTNGATNSRNMAITVNNVAPVVTFSAANDTTPDEGATEQYDYTVSDPGGDAVTVGTPSCGTGTLVNSMTNRFRCNFLNGPASTSVSISATDDDSPGLTGTGTQSISVQNVNPSVTAPSSQTATQGVAKSFTLGSFSDPGAEASWSVTVNWGDGSTNDTFTSAGNVTSAICSASCSLGSRTHTYATTGSKTVTVTVNDGTGSGQATFSVSVASADATAPTIAFSQSPDGSNGWFKSAPATLHVTATDASGVASLSCKVDGSLVSLTGTGSTSTTRFGDVTTSVNGDHLVECEAVDSSTSANTTPFASNQTHLKLDVVLPSIVPTVTGTLGSHGWYTSNVDVSWAVTDATSGVNAATKTGCGSITISVDTGGTTLTCSADDNAGNHASNFVTIKRDTTNPVSAATAGSATVTNTSPFTINYTASDASPGSGLDKVELFVKRPGDSGYSLALTDSTPSASESFTYTPAAGEGTYSFYTRATDQAGNVEVPPGAPDAQVTVLLDQTAPVTTDNTDSAWHKVAVSVTLSATDGPVGSPSGVDKTFYKVDGGSFAEYSGPFLIGAPSDHTNDGSHTITYYSTDNATNQESNKVATVKIDTTNPTVNCGSADGAWHANDVSIACTASDGPAGLANSTDASFTLSTNVPANTETSNASTGSRTILDNAGNSSTAGPIPNNKVDKKGPSVTLTTPPEGATYTLNQAVAAAFGCTDAGSGPATCLGTVANGSNINTSSVGSKAFTVNATDAVGNAAAVTHNYKVNFNFLGFFQPVDMGKMNIAQAGSAIPVKFSLGGNQGLGIFWTGYPLARVIACDTSTPTDVIEETVTAGGSSLTYDSSAGQYIYVWKTDKAWANSCRQLEVKFIDGQLITAMFQFKK
jgi:hypothetical protein